MSDTEGGRPAWEHNYEGGCVGYTDAGTGTVYTVGAAKPYIEIDESDGNREREPNCYSYALGYYDRSYDPGEYAGVGYNLNVESVARAVEKDMAALGRGCRRLDSYDSPVSNNEYRVALRTSRITYFSLKYRKDVFWDYHFMVQTSDGGWSEKHGPGGATDHHDNVNPDTISWDLGSYHGYYDSNIIYFAFSD